MKLKDAIDDWFGKSDTRGIMKKHNKLISKLIKQNKTADEIVAILDDKIYNVPAEDDYYRGSGSGQRR
tara:strand:+ start:6907 stop:7110 length:204 start_codon:yes stop_codon:yes gene_type:complete